MRGLSYPNTWTIGEWTFYEVHGLTGHEGKALFGFGDGTRDSNGDPKYGELYNSLDHAMVAAVGEKHTGPRGAGGSGVGTAADWFMRMIGAGQLAEAGPDGGRVLMEAVREHGDAPLAAHKIERALEAKGLIIARQPIS
jgi:hypothetical protein